MRRFGLPCSVSILLALCVAAAAASPAQTFTTLVSFDGKDGLSPYGPLVQGTDGNFYGTTYLGGANCEGFQKYGCGTVFKITPTGTLTTLYSFCSQSNCTDGSYPGVSLVLGTDGNLYGTTNDGGSGAGGTVFTITSKGELTTLYNFCSQPNCTDGLGPFGGLIQATDGKFYGTTGAGGTNCEGGGCGTVFKITAKGKLTTLYSFCSQPNCADGQGPMPALVQATDGNFYGTTQDGGTGAGESGTVFKITSRGAFTSLYSFCSQPNCADGAFPNSPLVQGADGNLYGTTLGEGGDFYDRTLSYGSGTAYRITPAGTLTTIYTFCSLPNCDDGLYPVGGLARGTDGNLYGMTWLGGTGGGYGEVFSITLEGTLTPLYGFCSQPNCTDGAWPFGGPIQGTDGTFYGLTSAGGIYACGKNYPNCGTAFSLSVGLGPFVETRPTAGKIGKKVIILGNNLNGASAVSFNGTAAVFKVVSGTEITTSVPQGATSGFVTVTTPNGTLTSNLQFLVP